MTFRKSAPLVALAAAACAVWVQAAAAETVKITPLGSHDGEFCRFDRALVLEDPDGTRLLFDAGRTVAGAEDPRLGDIDVVLVSHMHGDHVGDRRISAVNSGDCGQPDMSVSTAPNTNSVDIVLAKNAQIVTGSDMAQFFGAKIKSLGGDDSLSKLVRFGASYQVGGVSITTVPAVHTNGVSPAFIGGELGELLSAAGVQIAAGPPTSYVLTFSNGLAVYLSGDTGITAGGNQHRQHVHHRADRSGIRHRRVDSTRVRHRLPRQRGGDRERQGDRRYQDGAVHRGDRGAGISSTQRPHDGIRRGRRLRQGLLVGIAAGLAGATPRGHRRVGSP